MKLETEEVDGGVLKVRLSGRMDIAGVDAIAVPFAGPAATDNRRSSWTVMSARAECVMLNKGPHVVEAVRFLGGLLERMEAHRAQQRPRLRRLAPSEP